MHTSLYPVCGSQLLERGDTVVAAARNPPSSLGLMALQKQHPQTLSLITLDTADTSSVEVCNFKNEHKDARTILGNMEFSREVAEMLCTSHAGRRYEDKRITLFSGCSDQQRRHCRHKCTAFGDVRKPT